jgi:DNA-binding transcriptional ArsR family regulator
MPANAHIHQVTVTKTLSLDGEPVDTLSFADKTIQLLYAAAPTMGGDGNTDDNELLIALRHPLRRQILRAMVEQDPISPRQISDELHEPLSNVSYHVRVLADCGAVTLVDTTPVRGSMQHFYSPSIDEPWALTVLGINEDGEPTEGGEDEEPSP